MSSRAWRPADPLAAVVGAARLASGVSFLVSPAAANEVWGGEADPSPTAGILLRSMGYRDALIGGLLLHSGLRAPGAAAGWFLASAGADAADLLGSVANHDGLSDRQRRQGIAGAVAGIAIGLLGALRSVSRPAGP